MRQINKIVSIYIFLVCFLSACNIYAMHISEGILPFEWAGLWLLAAIPFIIIGIFKINRKSINTPFFKPFLGMMGAVVFIISCMPVPIPITGTCSHPCGTGISAIMLGPILSILISAIALLFQALFLAHGGLSTLGANIISMGVVGSFSGYFTFKLLRKFNVPLFISGFFAGLFADWLTYITTSFELASALHGSKPMLPLFISIIAAFVPTQLPLGILEGIITGGMIMFVYNKRPDILISMGVIKESEKDFFKKTVKIFFVLFICLSFFISSKNIYAKNTWSGVDETVVEKVAEEHGRTACPLIINTDQGDLLLFVFLLAGTIGGFILGYNFHKIFIKKEEHKDVK